jgi:hypothetical protein
VHDIAAKALDVDIVVAEYVSIESVIEPHLFKFFVFEVFFEQENKVLALPKVINEDPWSILERDMRSTE